MSDEFQLMSLNIVTLLTNVPIDYAMDCIFENINNRLKKIIMTNRKSVVNDNKIEAVPSWFIVPFIRDIIEKLSKLNSERMRI